MRGDLCLGLGGSPGINGGLTVLVVAEAMGDEPEPILVDPASPRGAVGGTPSPTRAAETTTVSAGSTRPLPATSTPLPPFTTPLPSNVFRPPVPGGFPHSSSYPAGFGQPSAFLRPPAAGGGVCRIVSPSFGVSVPLVPTVPSSINLAADFARTVAERQSPAKRGTTGELICSLFVILDVL